jgi:chromosome segregation ATPase
MCTLQHGNDACSSLCMQFDCRVRSTGGKQPGGMKPMPEQSHVASPSGLVPVDPREELAMQQARIAQLAGEVRELRTMNEGLRAQGESRDLELAKEKRNHSHAQQNLHALEAQLQDIEQRFQLQLKQQNMHTQQHGKAKRHEIENIGLEYEAKLANVIGEYQEKLAAKESELIQMMDLLAEKDSMLSTVLPQRATAGEGNSSPASKMQDPSSPASPSTTVDNDKKELLNSLESMKIMLSNSKTEEERLYNQLAQAKENEKKLLDNLTEMQQGDEALESKIQTLSARVLTLSEKLEHTTQLLQNEITAHKACKEALVQSENALRACQDAKRESEQTCLDLEEQIKLQADKENALTSRLENQATKLKAAEHKAAESERAHDLTAETLRLAQEQLNHFENKLKELEQQDRERRQSAYESTKKTVEKYATLLEGMEGKVDVLEEEGRSMRQDLVRLRAEADESASKLDNERAVRKEAEETVRILSNQLSVEKEASVAMVDEKVASLENEIEKERERRRRIEV